MRQTTRRRCECKTSTIVSSFLIVLALVLISGTTYALGDDSDSLQINAAISANDKDDKDDKEGKEDKEEKEEKEDKDRAKEREKEEKENREARRRDKEERDHKEVVDNLDKTCAKLTEEAAKGKLRDEQEDLLKRCQGIAASTDPGDQLDAYRELDANDFAAVRSQALGFSGNQYYGVMNRLSTMRRSGPSSLFDVRGLSLSLGGKPIPIYHLREAAEELGELFGRGGREGNGEKRPFLSERVGLWARSNYDWGDKDVSPANDGFDSNQWGFTGGMDYRFGQGAILGVALGYGDSDMEFRRSNSSGVTSSSWTASVYGTVYPWRDLYVDAVLNYGDARYSTTRNIFYSEGDTAIDRTAHGDTGGRTVSGGFSVGYDINKGNLALSPTAGYFHTRAAIGSFEERGASGLDLAFGDQKYSSSTANVSLALNYVWNTAMMTVLPHVRAEYLYELNDDIEVFGVRFANDPFAGASNPNPPIIVQSDVPDQQYWRLAAGMSAQFKWGFSGYFEYQRLQNFRYVNYQNITVGVRFQRGVL